MAENERGMLGKTWDYIKDRVAPEIGDMLVQKTAQGAAELGQAMNGMDLRRKVFINNPLRPVNRL